MRRPGPPPSPTLAAVHTWTGEAPSYDLLGAALDAQVVQLGLPGEPFPADVEGWVRHHVAQLDRLGLGLGPLHLIGWSFGGVVALEMARRLRAAGGEVAMVTMIDTTCPRLRPRGAAASAWYHLGEAAGMPAGSARRRYLGRWFLRMAKNRWFAAKWAARRAGRRLGLRDRSAPLKGPRDPLTRSIHRSYLGYQASNVDFPVHLVVTASSQRRQYGDPSLGWARWLRGGFTVDHVPGGHYDLFTPDHIEEVAAAVDGQRSVLHLLDQPGQRRSKVR